MITSLVGDETLRVYYDGVLLFANGGSWLHPLFDLEAFLATVRVDRSRLFLIDTITGKAAALLVIRMGIRAICSGIISEPARAAYNRAGVTNAARRVVERIDCKTESLLEHVDDVDVAYQILSERAGRLSQP